MSVPRKLIVAGLFALVAAPVCLGALGGCSSDKANAVVELCGDLSVPDDIESVRVVIYDQHRTPLRQGVRELWDCPGPTLHSLPQTLEFEPVEGDVFVEVQGLKEGAPVIRSELRVTLGAEDDKATVSLTKACMGARCAAGETCVQGKCELVALAARAVSSCSLGQAAGEPDAPQDTGTSDDAQAPDAGHTHDAGDIHDAGEIHDAGTTPDAGTSDTGTPSTRPGAYLCPQEDDESQEPDAGSPDDASDAADTEEGSQ